jgi:hypothetical protein
MSGSVPNAPETPQGAGVALFRRMPGTADHTSNLIERSLFPEAQGQHIAVDRTQFPKRHEDCVVFEPLHHDHLRLGRRIRPNRRPVAAHQPAQATCAATPIADHVVSHPKQPESRLSPIWYVIETTPHRQEHIGRGLHRVLSIQTTEEVGQHIGLMALIQLSSPTLSIHDDPRRAEHPYMSGTRLALSPFSPAHHQGTRED